MSTAGAMAAPQRGAASGAGAAARDLGSTQPALARTAWPRCRPGGPCPARRRPLPAVAAGVALAAAGQRPMAGLAGRRRGRCVCHGGAAPARRPGCAELQEGAMSSAGRRMTLAEFTRWVKDVLEAARFVARSRRDAPVVVLPMPQLLGRPFAAAVLPGCDEKRLQPAPEPSGDWTQASARPGACPRARRWKPRSAPPGTPTRCARTAVDVLWRTSDEGGEPLLASALVLAAATARRGQQGADARPPARRGRPPPRCAPCPSGPGAAGAAAVVHRVFRPAPLPLPLLCAAPAGPARGRRVGRRRGQARLWQLAACGAAATFMKTLRDQPTRWRTQRSGPHGQRRCRSRDPRAGPGKKATFCPLPQAGRRLRDGYLHWLDGHEQAGRACSARPRSRPRSRWATWSWWAPSTASTASPARASPRCW
jgi:ATP-dependent helicase/nuclease subunit B